MKPNALSDAMKEAGSAEALAARLGVSRRTVFNWLRDGVPRGRIEHVAEATGVPASALLPDLAKVFAAEAAH